MQINVYKFVSAHDGADGMSLPRVHGTITSSPFLSGFSFIKVKYSNKISRRPRVCHNLFIPKCRAERSQFSYIFPHSIIAAAQHCYYRLPLFVTMLNSRVQISTRAIGIFFSLLLPVIVGFIYHNLGQS